MAKAEKVKSILALVEKAIDTSDYSLILKAFDMAYEADMFMAEDVDYIVVEDELIRFSENTF